MANPNFAHEGGGALVDSVISTAGVAYTKAAGFPVPSAGAYDASAPQLVELAGVTVFIPLSAVDVSAEVTIWTPASGKKFRLMGYVITQAVATGDVALKDDTGGTTILVIPANALGLVQVSPGLGQGIPSAAANNVLTATGVSTELLSGYVFGREE